MYYLPSSTIRVRRPDGRGDSAAHVEARLNAHLTWIESGDKLLQHDVGHVLVEVALISKRPQVELERLELYDAGPRNIRDGECGKVRLARHRADARKLRTDHLHLIPYVGMRVGNHFNGFAGARGHQS